LCDARYIGAMSVRRTVIALCLAASTLVATASVVPSQAASVEQEGRAALRYVALGDSYSAGSGVVPVDVTSPMCLRSTRNYPHVIAELIDARLTDVTCGGADTTHYRTEQYPGVAPQLKALSRTTQLVTMTIGGNDSGVFISSILQCGTLGIASAGRGSPCRDTYGNSFVRTVRRTTAPDIEKALRAVHRKAPRATVAILGYPRILPPKRGCFPQMPVARGDVPYLFKLQRVLNKAVRRAADATDSVYVDVPRASRGHDACQVRGRRWVEPVALGTNPVIVHPNARGEAAMARLTIRKLDLS